MKNLALILFGLLMYTSAFAQEDAEGCKDHPMFNRMPNFYIIECTKNYGLADLVMSNGDSKSIEGYKTYIRYEFNTESGQETPSFFQVFKNYENALKKYGVKRIYLASQYGTLFFKAEGKSVWLGIEAPGETAGWCSLTILEIEDMVQDISANAMLDALNTNGSIALNILFDTGKSTIKSESLPIVDQIYEMMNSSPDLKVSIEGHTDNVGVAASNKTLSQNRSKAVMDALVAKGVDKTRMSSLGWGQEKPVADNATDEGKAQNRRVEIVKK